MIVDAELGRLSDNLFVVAVLLYSVGMLLSAAEYAFGGRRSEPNREPASARPPALVGAGGPVSPPSSATRTDGVAAAGRPGAAHLGQIALALTAAGWLSHGGTLVARGMSAGHVPWGNMYEFTLGVCFVAVTGWLVVSRRERVRQLGSFVLLPVVLLLGLAGTVLYAPAAPLVPALNSYWLKIHVSAAIIATGIFLVAFATSGLYLLRVRYEQVGTAGGSMRFPTTLGVRLPAVDALDRLTFRLIAFAFPIWTFAVIAGAIWGEAAWGRYWAWDPKETWAFITWLIYAAYLHAHATAGWRGTRSVLIAVAGWAAMMFNLFAVNMLIAGLHSYAGLS